MCLRSKISNEARIHLLLQQIHLVDFAAVSVLFLCFKSVTLSCISAATYNFFLPGLCALVLFSLEWKVSFFSLDAYKYVSDLNFCFFTGFVSKVTRKFWTSVSVSTTVSAFCSVDFHSCRFVVLIVDGGNHHTGNQHWLPVCCGM